MEKFDQTILDQLVTHPDEKEVKELQGNLYIKTCVIIETMNKIFGAGAWSQRVVTLEHAGTRDFVKKQNNGPDKKGWQVGYRAIVEVEVLGRIYRDVGFGDGVAYTNPFDAHDLASKTAASVGLKRAVRVLGNALGNLLYDSDVPKRDKVSKDAPVQQPAESANAAQPTSAKQESQARTSGSFMTSIKSFKEADGWMEVVLEDGSKAYCNEEDSMVQMRQHTIGVEFNMNWKKLGGSGKVALWGVKAKPGSQANPPPKSQPDLVYEDVPPTHNESMVPNDEIMY